MTQELDKIIERHQHWLKEDCEGWEDMRADLREANLSGADLSFVNLREADLREANLGGANLRFANLRAADLGGADLRLVNLRAADLSAADLSAADLSGANLGMADLSAADLSMANLSGANLGMANLSRADLSMADLRDANLSVADRFRLGQIITEPITGYKKTNEGVVITVEIPAGSIVFCINGSKCRTNRAKITDMAGHYVLHSLYNNSFEYHIGQEINIKDFNLMYNVECASGFHFFKTRKEAEEYK